MENAKLAKMKRTAKGLDIFLKALQILLIVGLAVLLLVDLIVLIGGGKTEGMRETFTELNLSVSGVLISPEMAESMNVDFNALLWLSNALFLAAGIYVFLCTRILRRVLKPMKEGKPFEESVSRDLSRLGWFVLIGGAVLAVMKELILSYLLRTVTFTPAEGMPAAVGADHSINLSFVFEAAVLFLSSYITRYGEELQRQSDETL